MPKKNKVDWNAVQRDRDAGVSVAELCEKYDVSNPTIYTRTHGPKNGKGHKAAPGKRKLQRSTANRAVNGYGPVLADLEAKRERLDRAIAAIRELAS